MKRDPITRMESYMLKNGFTEAELGDIDKRTFSDIENAVRFAEQSQFPPVDTICDNVYA